MINFETMKNEPIEQAQLFEGRILESINFEAVKKRAIKNNTSLQMPHREGKQL